MARVDNLSNFLTDIASAIRVKTGSTESITPNNFDIEIQNIKPKLDGISQVSLAYTNSSDAAQEILNSINTANLKTYADMFNCCYNLTYIPSFEYNTSINNAMNMFNGCSNITAIPNLDYTKFYNKANMFQGCLRLTDISNIEGHNIGNYMFANCYNIIDINYNMTINGIFTFANCYNITNLSPLIKFSYSNTNYCFSNCRNLVEATIYDNQFLSDSMQANGWFSHCYNLQTVNLNLNKIYDADSLFIRCRNLQSINGIPLNNLNLQLPSLHSASYMFYEAPVDNLNLTVIGPKSSSPSHGDGSTRDFSYMFYGCTSLNNIKGLNIGGATTTAYMFSGCTYLTNLPEINLDSVYQIVGMFNSCKNINNIHLKGLYNTTDWSMLFHNCNNLTNVYINDSRTASDMYSTFANCYNLRQINVPWSTEINLYYTFERCWNLYYANYNTSIMPGFNISNVVSCFCGFEEGRFDVDITNLTKMKNAAYAFYGCWNIYSTSYDLNYSHVHNLVGMFNNAGWHRTTSTNNYLPKLNSINVGNNPDLSDFLENCDWFNVKYILGNNIRRTAGLFANWGHANFPNMDTSKVTNAYRMFYNTPIASVPSGYNFSNLEEAGYMFSNCQNLKQLTHSMPKVKSMYAMFNYCKNLTSFPTGINLANVTNFSYTFNSTGVSYVPANMKNAENLYYAFGYCNNLTNVSNIAFNNVTCAYSVFTRCNNLTTVNNVSFNILQNAAYLFSNLPNVTTLHNLRLPNATSVVGLFANSNAMYANVYCPKATDLGGMYQNSKLGSYINSSVQSLLPNAINTSYMFANTNLSTVIWTGANTTNGAYMYRNTKINVVPEYANFQNVTGLYYGCNSITNVNILRVPYSNTASSLFGGCAYLNSVNTLYLNNVDSVYSLFSGMVNLTTLNKIIAPKATSGAYVLQTCNNLRYVDEINLPMCTNLYYAFSYCNNLIAINKFTADFANMTSYYDVRRMFMYCNNLSDKMINTVIESLLSTKISVLNLSNANSYSPFYSSNITSDRYSSYLDRITAKGWTY